MKKHCSRVSADLDAVLPIAGLWSDPAADSSFVPELPRLYAVTDFARACAPWNYEPNYAYPLIVWLTDPTCDSADALDNVSTMSPQNYLGLAVDGCTLPGGGGALSSDSVTQLNAIEDRVVAAVQIFRESFNVHPDRVFLAGVGAAATTALLISLHQADWFAGAISFGGEFPVLGRLLAHRREVAGRRFWLNGPQSESLWPEAGPVADAARALVGMSADVTTCLDGSDQMVSPLSLRQLDDWILHSIFA